LDLRNGFHPKPEGGRLIAAMGGKAGKNHDFWGLPGGLGLTPHNIEPAQDRLSSVADPDFADVCRFEFERRGSG